MSWPGDLSTMPYMQPAPWFAQLNPLPSLSAGLSPAGYQAALQAIAPSGYSRSQGGYGYDGTTGPAPAYGAAAAPAAAPTPPAALSPAGYGGASVGGGSGMMLPGYGAPISPTGYGAASAGGSGMMPVNGDPFATVPSSMTLNQALLTGNMGFGPEMWSQVRLMNDQLTAQSPFATQAQKDTAAKEAAAGPMMVMAPIGDNPPPLELGGNHDGRAG